MGLAHPAGTSRTNLADALGRLAGGVSTWVPHPFGVSSAAERPLPKLTLQERAVNTGGVVTERQGGHSVRKQCARQPVGAHECSAVHRPREDVALGQGPGG
jgi:hypothetical protein